MTRPVSDSEINCSTAFSAVDTYFHTLISLLQDLHRREVDAIRKVAGVAADALSKGRMLHILDNGHFLRDELINRAGGLGALHKLTNSADLNNIALVRSGDLVFLGSVSGRSTDIVEAATIARDRDVISVGLTSSGQAAVAEPAHPSGKLLRDVVDYVLDIGGVAGDAMLTVPGLDVPICPSSGIAAASIMWATMAETAAILAGRGTPPTIFTSVNVPNGMATYEAQLKRLRIGGM